MFSAYTQALLLGRDHSSFLLSNPMTGFVQISGVFCSAAENLICNSRYSAGAKPCTPLACSVLPCCLLPSPLPRLPELWLAWTEFANTWYMFKERSSLQRVILCVLAQ